MTKRSYICIWVMVAYGMCCLYASLASAETFSSREYKIKAGLIYNLTKFVEYPEAGNDTSVQRFIIGILGEDPFKNEIDILDGKTVKGKQLEIRRYHTIEDVEDAQILFVCASETCRLPEILTRLKQKSVLTISDMNQFSENGGMIHFVTLNNRITFKVNFNAVKQENLKLSAHFLKLVTIVE